MKCEKCQNEHDGGYGSGRFCSPKCSRSFSTAKNREEISKKVSVSLLGRTILSDEKMKKFMDSGDAAREIAFSKRKEDPETYYRERWIKGKLPYIDRNTIGKYVPENVLTINGKGPIKKVLLSVGVPYRCDICGLSEWREKPMSLDLHHKNGNRKDNRVENLQLLCRNCHGQTDNYAGKGKNQRKQLSDEEIVSALVSSANPNQVREKLGLSVGIMSRRVVFVAKSYNLKLDYMDRLIKSLYE